MVPGSPCRAQRPKSCRSIRADSCSSVPITCSPPSWAHLFADLNVSPASGHVRCDHDFPQLPCLGDNFGFAFHVVGIQDQVRQSPIPEQLRKQLRFGDRTRANENRATELVDFQDFGNHGFPFFLFGGRDNRRQGDSLGWPIGRDHLDGRSINLAELRALVNAVPVMPPITGKRLTNACTVIFASVRVSSVTLTPSSLRSPGESRGSSAAGRNSPRRFVDDHDLAIANDVVLVQLVVAVYWIARSMNSYISSKPMPPSESGLTKPRIKAVPSVESSTFLFSLS